MDSVQLITTILGGGTFSMFIVQFLKEDLTWIKGRYGSLAMQGVLLGVSFCIALLAILINLLPSNVLLMTSGIFVSAMTIYEILYKALWQETISGKV